MGVCHLCPPDDGNMPDAEILPHLRQAHPELYTREDVPEQWPDGRPVIVDVELSPADFTEETP
jgi:hypothetical protein